MAATKLKWSGHSGILTVTDANRKPGGRGGIIDIDERNDWYEVLTDDDHLMTVMMTKSKKIVVMMAIDWRLAARENVRVAQQTDPPVTAKAKLTAVVMTLRTGDLTVRQWHVDVISGESGGSGQPAVEVVKVMSAETRPGGGERLLFGRRRTWRSIDPIRRHWLVKTSIRPSVRRNCWRENIIVMGDWFGNEVIVFEGVLTGILNGDDPKIRRNDDLTYYQYYQSV